MCVCGEAGGSGRRCQKNLINYLDDIPPQQGLHFLPGVPLPHPLIPTATSWGLASWKKIILFPIFNFLTSLIFFIKCTVVIGEKEIK